MIDTLTSDAVLAKLTRARERNQAITYCDESPDNEHPEIKWQFFGLIETNEIATVARIGKFAVAACRESPLLYPAMVDRIFGVDVSDMNVAMELGNELWNKHKDRLLAELEIYKRSLR